MFKHRMKALGMLPKGDLKLMLCATGLEDNAPSAVTVGMADVTLTYVVLPCGPVMGDQLIDSAEH